MNALYGKTKNLLPSSTPLAIQILLQLLHGKKTDGSRTDVPFPSSMKLYNMNMGGVDLADQKRKAYSCTRKSTKWYMRLFWYLVDIAIVNGHVLQLESGNYRKQSQKNF